MLIEALAVLQGRAPERSFAAMFFGTVSDEFRELIIDTAEKFAVDRQVFLMGFRTPPDPFLIAADVVVTPAVDEGFGRVPIEAMMLGTPVVASNAGNHPELIKDGETGSLVLPDDPTALADKILAIVSDAAWRSRTVALARREACERFGVAASAKAVSDVYQSLLSAGAAASTRTATR